MESIYLTTYYYNNSMIPEELKMYLWYNKVEDTRKM